MHPPTSLPPTSRCLTQALITVAFAAALPWLLRTAPGLLLAFPVTGGIPFLMHGLLMRVNDGWIVSEERRRKANSRFSYNVPLLSLYNIFEVGGAHVPSWAFARSSACHASDGLFNSGCAWPRPCVHGCTLLPAALLRKRSAQQPLLHPWAHGPWPVALLHRCHWH